MKKTSTTDITRIQSEKSYILFIKNSVTDEITRIILPESVQIGLSERPQELVLTGRLGLSSTEIVPSDDVDNPTLLSNNDTLVFLSTTGGSSNVYVKLPETPRTGQIHFIKDSNGFAGAETINISGFHNIDGSSTDTLITNYETIALTFNGTEWKKLLSFSGGGGAPNDAEYVVKTSNGALTNEYVLSSGSGTSVSSGVGIISIDLTNTGVSAGSYTYASLTVDAKGRLTAASNGAIPAPLSSSYVVITNDVTLTHERALAVTAGHITLTDGGANSNVTLGLATTAVAAGAYTCSSITVDSYGRITAASSGVTLSGYTLGAPTYATAFGVSTASEVVAASHRTLFGYSAGNALTTGGYNSCFGVESGLRITTGSHNTLFGSGTGIRIVTGTTNSAFGADALQYNTGSNNTAIGNAALRGTDGVSTASHNTAVGINSSYSITTGIGNTTLGNNTGSLNLAGDYNTYIGNSAGYYRLSGYNIGIGHIALQGAIGATGANNVAVGNDSGVSITSGGWNTLLGHFAGNAITTASANVLIGYASGFKLTTSNNYCCLGADSAKFQTGWNNIAVGYQALYGSDGASTGDNNCIVGCQSGFSLTTGAGNVVCGSFALQAATTAAINTAVGNSSLQYVSGAYNVAVGFEALRGVAGSSTAETNVAVGIQAGVAITTGTNNTLLGPWCASVLTSGSNNAIIGRGSGNSITTTSNNTYLGGLSTGESQTGSNNTAVGTEALKGAGGATGNSTVAVGYRAGFNQTSGYGNTLIGTEAGVYSTAITTGHSNTCVGHLAGVSSASAEKRTALGYNAVSLTDSVVRLGELNTTTVIGGAYTTDSDKRLKTNIQESDLGLDFILSLQPKKYVYTGDQQKQLNYGFIAQDIKAVLDKHHVNNCAIWHESTDKDPKLGYKPQGVIYDELIAPLVKAVQELSSITLELQREISLLKLEKNS